MASGDSPCSWPSSTSHSASSSSGSRSSCCTERGGGPPMSTIVPRWEWRAFARWFGPAEDAFAALPASDPIESEELYLLSRDGDTVKIRGGLLDIKRLRETDEAG